MFINQMYSKKNKILKQLDKYRYIKELHIPY